MIIEMQTAHGPIRAVGNPIKVADATPRTLLPPLLNEHGSRA